jgi:hypothetical protein
VPTWTWLTIPAAAARARLWQGQNRMAEANRILHRVQSREGSDSDLFGYWNEGIALARAPSLLWNKR